MFFFVQVKSISFFSYGHTRTAQVLDYFFLHPPLSLYLVIVTPIEVLVPTLVVLLPIFVSFLKSLPFTGKARNSMWFSRSSLTAEYTFVANATSEAQWLLYLLKDLHIDHPAKVTLHCDNNSAIYIVVNSVFHECTKHIVIDCHVDKVKSEMSVMKTYTYRWQCLPLLKFWIIFKYKSTIYTNTPLMLIIIGFGAYI